MKLTLLFLALSLAAAAQTLDTLAGVRLEGSLSNPIVINGSTEAILAIRVVFDLGEDQKTPVNKLFVDPGMAMVPGAQNKVRQTGPVQLNFFGINNKTGDLVPAESLVKGVRLEGVVFADGGFVGPASDSQVAAMESQFQRIRNMAIPEFRHEWKEQGMAKGIADALMKVEAEGDPVKLKAMEDHYLNLPTVHRRK
jgi:hypothetical protein